MKEYPKTEESIYERRITNVSTCSISTKDSEEIQFKTTQTSNLKLTKVGSIDEAPEFLKDNEYIKHGYRINFNSTRHVVKSLFILHNESVNIWSHLLGALMVIVLILYTTLYINTHNDELFENLPFNITSLNEEIKQVTQPVLSLIPNFKNFSNDIEEKYEESKSLLNHLSDSIVKKTFEYVDLVNEKIGIYQKYVTCKQCFDDVIQTLANVKDSLREHVMLYKNKFVNESIYIIEKIEDSSVGLFIEDINEKLVVLKDKIADLIISPDKRWGDIYEREASAKLEKWPMFVMLLSAITCLGCSFVFHWFGAHSKHVHDLLNRLDYAGISILIAGSCYPPYFYFFYCESSLKIIYLSFISVFALSVFFYSLKPDFTNSNKRKLRGILFLTLGLSTGLPLRFQNPPHLIFWYLGGISYVTGAVIYILRIPEKFRPGKHDIWGSSHQIFHFFVVLGVIFHYLGSLDAYYYRVENTCPV